MAKIKLSVPDSPFHATIDSDVMEVALEEVYLGVRFSTPDGEELSVCMRDGGYELVYTVSGEYKDSQVSLYLQNGVVRYG